MKLQRDGIYVYDSTSLVLQLCTYDKLPSKLDCFLTWDVRRSKSVDCMGLASDVMVQCILGE